MKRTASIFIMVITFVAGMNAQAITGFNAGSSISATAMNTNFDNIVAKFAALEARIADLEDDFPLGTIIASFIPPAGVDYMTGSIEWALADGVKPVDATGYIVTASLPFPDMRGQFIRGMNVSGGADPDTRAIGSIQVDAFQGHAHFWQNEYLLWSGTHGGTGTSASASGTSTDLRSIGTMSIISDGSNGTPNPKNETRPDNVAVYWYIKVK